MLKENKTISYLNSVNKTLLHLNWEQRYFTSEDRRVYAKDCFSSYITCTNKIDYLCPTPVCWNIFFFFFAGKITDIHGNSFQYNKEVKHMNSAGVLATLRNYDYYASRIPNTVKQSLVP